MKTLLSYKSLIKATIITIIVGISASQMTTYAGTPIPQGGWNLWFVDSEATPTYAATNAFDGNINTIWHTEWIPIVPLPHDIQIDLGASYDIDGFRYLPRQSGVNGRIGQYEFYVSVNGASWGTAVASGTFANNATEKEVTFTPKTGRYVRLKALSEVNGKQFTSMAEIKVLESGSGGGGSGGGGTGANPSINAWSQKLSASERFEKVLPIFVFNGIHVVPEYKAVLDRETGLVWEASPGNTIMNWQSALKYCYGVNLGGRGGWKLPQIEELRSLVDPTKSNPALPSGYDNFFSGVQMLSGRWYWSATTEILSVFALSWQTQDAHGVDFSNGSVEDGSKMNLHNWVWCVRGGQGHDGQ